MRKKLTIGKKKRLHICRRDCDPSHKVWLDNNPNDPILDGELIHHKDEDHDNNEPENQQKMTLGGHSRLHNTGVDNPFYGKRHSEETKRKMSIVKSGENNFNYGKHFSKDHKLKLSISHLGKIFSKEHKRNISVSKSGENHPMFGKRHSEETKEKMSKALSGRKHPMYGRKLTKEHIQALADGKRRKKEAILV